MFGDFFNFAEALCNDFMLASLRTGSDDEEFNRFAMELFSLQRRHNSAYGHFCERRRIGEITNWTEMPAVPTVAFKELELTSLSPSERTGVFFSSGTTKQDRSRHFHSSRSLAVYEASLWNWFANVFERERQGVRWLFLTPSAKQAPNSSLAYMFSAIAARQKGGARFGGIVNGEGAWSIDGETVLNFLLDAETIETPVAILGTAFSFVHLLDELERKGLNIRLPENSWVMETGGYKGRSREMPKEELHCLITARLGVASNRIFGEYGMSELSSQAYAGVDGVFRFPPWARAQIISPETGREGRAGERGLIRVFDLANVWSVMAVQTEDIGIKEGDGFRLVGRAAAAEARGCSLMTAA
jgi:hypothetical protein